MDDNLISSGALNRSEKASWTSKLFLLWAFDVVKQRYKGVELTDDDYGNPPINLIASGVGIPLKRKWALSENKNRSLLKVLCRTYIKDACLASFCLFLKIGILFPIQSTLQKLLISSFFITDSDENLMLKRYASSAFLIVSVLITPFLSQLSLVLADRLGAKIRIATSIVIFEKLLTMKTAEINCINIGKIINLFAIDTSKLEENTRLISTRLFDVLIVLIITVYLHFLGGWPALCAFFVIFAAGIINTVLAKVLKISNKKKSNLADKRLKLTQEMISEAKSMKMLCLENSFCNTINGIRNKELKFLFYSYCYKMIFSVLNSVATPFALFIMLYLIILEGNNTAELARVIFPCFSLLNVIQFVVLVMLNRTIESASFAVVSIRRIEAIINVNETKNNIEDNAELPVLNNVISSWEPILNHEIERQFFLKLDHLSLPSTLTMIVGPIGSGKSTLLLTLANELYIHSGSIAITNSTTYMPQQPWLFPATIRQNILFGLPYDEERYHNILACCALNKDLDDMQNGDLMNVDDKGFTLSGGQKSRISIARALYRKSEIYLLDDPLSSVDVKVGKHIWENCFHGSGKTILLASHQIHFLSDNCFVVLLDKFRNEINRQILNIFAYTVTQRSSKLNLIRKFWDKSLKDFSVSNVELYVLKNTSNLLYKGLITRTGYYSELKNTLIARFQTDVVNDMIENCTNKPHQMKQKTFNRRPLQPKIATETIHSSPITENPILIYCKMVLATWNGWFILLLLLILSISVQCIITTFTLILTNGIKPENIFEIGHLMSLLGFLLIALLFSCVIQYSIFLFICHKASKTLHEKMLRAVANTSMTFYDNNNIGQIINRFSKDLELVDRAVPTLTIESLKLSCMVIGSMINFGYSNSVTVIPLVICMAGVIFIIKVYHEAVGSVKRNEASARSPIFTYINCSVKGVAVIRSHKNQPIITEEFNAKLDKHSAIWFIMKGITYWMTLYVEILGNAIFIAIIVLTLLFPQFSNESRLGLGITSTFVFGSFMQLAIRTISEANHLIVAVVRLKEYIDLPREKDIDNLLPLSPIWPFAGSITFDRVSLQYSIGNEKALKNITFHIKSGEKIGIVGRTGAGKSSLTTALFRLAPIEGTIKIDGTDIQQLSFNEYRKKLSIIPQNPVLLSGSIRHNLDVHAGFNDEDLWGVLESVQLKEEVLRLGKGLDDEMTQFSVGQKQLFCIARTLLRKNMIIILDEATSNVDNNTDVIIQNLIRSKFQHSTMLIIAHRLQTVLDLDKIMVMQNGEIVEFDSANNLLKNQHGVFTSMMSKI